MSQSYFVPKNTPIAFSCIPRSSAATLPMLALASGNLIPASRSITPDAFRTMSGRASRRHPPLQLQALDFARGLVNEIGHGK
jgi:hypothetical protein